MNRLRKFAQLPGWERRILIRSFLLLPLTALGLRILGFRRCTVVLTCLVKGKTSSSAESFGILKSKAKRIGNLVGLAVRHGLFRPACLPKSMVLWSLMRANGLSGEICFGARKKDGRMEAHAWVEFDGVPVADSADVSEWFSRFDSIESYRANL